MKMDFEKSVDRLRRDARQPEYGFPGYATETFNGWHLQLTCSQTAISNCAINLMWHLSIVWVNIRSRPNEELLQTLLNILKVDESKRYYMTEKEEKAVIGNLAMKNLKYGGVIRHYFWTEH
jgi:hypothetical protein